MTKEERQLLLELKAFLVKAIDMVDDQLIFTDPSVSQRDYDFLIDKVKMYRDNLETINKSLENNG
jgi:hypothetical protein